MKQFEESEPLLAFVSILTVLYELYVCFVVLHVDILIT